MTAMTRNMLDRLEGWLLRRGYTHPEVRELVRNQFVLTGLVVIVCALLTPLWDGAWALAVGTVLVTFNFCSLARFGQRITGYANRREAVAAVLVRFYLRLAVTGFVLFVCIAWAGPPRGRFSAGRRLGTGISPGRPWPGSTSRRLPMSPSPA